MYIGTCCLFERKKNCNWRERPVYSPDDNNATAFCQLVKNEIQMIGFSYSKCFLSNFESSVADFITVSKLKGWNNDVENTK